MFMFFLLVIINFIAKHWEGKANEVLKNNDNISCNSDPDRINYKRRY